MDIDREYQREMLLKLRETYPRPFPVHEIVMQEGHDQEKYVINMLYLESHGLVDSSVQISVDGFVSKGDPQLTHLGIDFLRDDGGLSAILGVVTIKIHDDTLKSLVEAKILQSDLPTSDKKKYVDALRKLPAETTKHLVLKLVDLGLAHAPTALAAIGTYLQIHG